MVHQFAAISDEQVENIRRLAREIQFGTLTLVFQDGKLIQIEKNEKIRLKSEH